MPVIDTPILARLWAALRQCCPRCCRGKIFRGSVTMNERCPVCDLQFEREQGYFFGAMYFSYFLSIGVMALLTLLGSFLFPGVRLEWIALGAVILFIPLVPVTFRYSRVLWIHLDRLVSPKL